MRSLSARMLLAALGTLLVSFIAFMMVFSLQARSELDTGFRGLHTLKLEDAVAALKRGGKPELSSYLDRLSGAGFPYYLTDGRGQDIVSGVDRSALLQHGRGGRSLRVNGRVVVDEASVDGQFHLVALIPSLFSMSHFLPYYVLIAAAVSLLWWLLAIGIASPIRQLTTAVGRFGRGDLESRATSVRRDEVGELARAFNDMAERIQMLMTAERRLLQDISHELRSPLARLSIGIELLRTTTDREHAIGRLQHQVERLTQLVGSLIEVTRNEGEPSSRKTEAVDVGLILRELVQSAGLESELRGNRIVVVGDADTVVLGDAELIRRALDNVLGNAIRYAPPDTAIDVHVTEGNAATVISIRDHGPGVPDSLLPRLTDPFFRVDAARDANTGGVGLGLAIAQRALRLHHGTLVAQNANPGLRVILTIPQVHVLQPEAVA